MIRSADPAAAPVIRPNYLSTDHDLAQVLAGARVVARLAETPAVRAITAAAHGFTPQGADDDAVIADFRERSGTVHHLCGTCRMAPVDQGGVVDAACRVHGIDGLRVVDAAIFPNVTSANTHAPVVMAAWRAAAMILADRKGPR
jgi:choline dehydrogenase